MSEHLLQKKSELIQSLDDASRKKLFKNSSFDSIFHMRKFEMSKKQFEYMEIISINVVNMKTIL